MSGKMDAQSLKDLGVSIRGRELFKTAAPMYVYDNGDGTYDITGTFVRRGLTGEELVKTLEILADSTIND